MDGMNENQNEEALNNLNSQTLYSDGHSVLC